MARNKYVKDYRLLESVDERGRIRVKSEYIGRYYVFAAGEKNAAAEKKRMTALCVLGWIAFVSALLPPSAAMSAAYIALPFVFAALPLGMLTSAVLSIPAGAGPMERRTADRIENALPPRALFAAALSGAALVGQLARLAFTRDGLWPGDAVFSLAAAVLAACGAAVFSRRGKLALRQTGERPAGKQVY